MGFFDSEKPRDASGQAVLDDLEETDWAVIRDFGRAMRFKAGENLLFATTPEVSVYFLTEGEVEVVVTGAFAREKSVALIPAPSIFGELSFFDGQPRSASIRSLTEGGMIWLSRQGFDRLAQYHPQLAIRLLKGFGHVLAQRFRRVFPEKL